MNRRAIAAVILALLFAILAGDAVHAQPEESLDDALNVRIGVIARGSADSIVLRWAVAKPAVWLVGSRVGYRIDRANVLRDGSHDSFKPIVDSAIVPWPIERWIAFKEVHPERDGADSADYPAIAFSLSSMYGAPDGPAKNEYPSDELESIAERKAELEMRYGFALYAADRSIAAASGLGLRFVDRAVSPGATYAYRVYLNGSAGDYRTDTGTVNVTASAPPPTSRANALARGGEGEVVLTWQANAAFGSYYVERSDNDGRTFRRMNAIPLVTLRSGPTTNDDDEIWRDSSAVNYVSYLYRIYGTTSFAETELLAEVRGIARDVTPPTKPFLPNPEHVSAREVRVKWTPGVPASTDLSGYRVLRSANDSISFVPISGSLLSPTTTEFTDTGFNPDTSNYYVVEAIDTAGNASRSNAGYVALIDSTPPAPPTWIAGSIDTNGIITLRLHANRERDLLGYRLLRANAPDHEFAVVIETFGDSTIADPRDTVYRDSVTIRTLTRRVYYRAIALDANHNESPFSEILSITRPDVIPPATPVVTDVFVTDNSVSLSYAPSSSEDVAYHVVYRRLEDAVRWDSIAQSRAHDSLFVDRDVKSTSVYNYAMAAVDSSSLRSEMSASVMARPYNSGVLRPVTNVRSRFDEASSSVEVRWDYEDLREDYWFIIYRAEGDAGISQYARVSSRERAFEDKSAPRGQLTYSVRAVAASGAESKLTERSSVQAGN